MVDKLRKIGFWFWRYKERMVLVAMLLFLFYRVYVVIQPPDSESLPPFKSVRNVAPEQIEGLPEPPQQRWFQWPAQPVDALVNSNMFTVYSTRVSRNPDEVTAKDLGITLNRIVPWREGGYRAEMTTRTNRSRLYSENEEFESFRLLRIDPVENQVTIFSQEYGKEFTISAGSTQ